MSSNKSVKDKMVKIYGSKCWIDKLHLRPVEDKPKRYKSKGDLKRMKQLTYHHIKPKSKGGRATIENGALLSAENHAWFHKQSIEIQNKLNQIFQDYKSHFSETCESESEQYECEISYDEFIDKARLHYNRAQMKRETQKIIDEYER